MADLSPPEQYERGPASIACVIQAAARQRVPANMLLAIASIEGGKNGEVARNKNGTADLSHFQINSDTFAREVAPLGVKLDDVLWRGCLNAEIAAYLLAKRLGENDTDDYWSRAANYHSKTPEFNAIYRRKLVALSTEWARWLQTNYSVNVTYR